MRILVMMAVLTLLLLPTLIYHNFMVPSSLRVSLLVLSHYDSPGIKVFYYLFAVKMSRVTQLRGGRDRTQVGF